jgi:pimeloyl-ACP methyl ester carboxylesterase
MPTLEIDDRQIFYAHRKSTKGLPPLLLIHGAGGSHLDWPPELLRLPGVDVYALDLPGHGRSSPPGHSTIGDYANDVLAFIEALDLREAILAGHSMGGAVVQNIGLDPAASIRGLVLIATGARLRVSNVILGSILTDPESSIAAITRYRWAEGAAADLVESGHEMMSQLDPHLLYGDFAACNSFDMMTQVCDIRIPTLVIVGSADQMTPSKYGEYLANSIPGSELILIEGAGHMIALERPAEVAAAIASFVDRL